MVNVASFQTVITNTIDELGSSITITPITVTINTRGDKTESTGTPVNTKGVPFDDFKFLGQLNAFNQKMNVGEVKLIIGSSEVIDQNDKVTYNGKDYGVAQIQPFEIQDVVLAIQLLLESRD